MNDWELRNIQYADIPQPSFPLVPEQQLLIAKKGGRVLVRVSRLLLIAKGMPLT